VARPKAVRKRARAEPISRGRGRTLRRPERELPELDRLIHERIRLGMISALAVNDALSFNDLKRILRTTDGNLAVHARKLEEAGYIRCKKFFDGRIPRTEYKLTPAGRRAFEEYLRQMEAFIARSREQQHG
jgi:DNA-binding HxlR family transcriptional regulator